MTRTGKPISAEFWWGSVNTNFTEIITYFLDKAKKAEAREHPDHECGHEWTISITGRGHSSGAGDDPTHSDANYTDTYKPVTVRAHNLRDALLLAAAKPLTAWFEEEEDTNVQTSTDDQDDTAGSVG
jgi:hypothetical protein